MLAKTRNCAPTLPVIAAPRPCHRTHGGLRRLAWLTRLAEISLYESRPAWLDRAAACRGRRRVNLRALDAEDADPAKGWVSTASPIGRAIVCREEGDEIAVKTPNGLREFEIIELTTIHETWLPACPWLPSKRFAGTFRSCGRRSS